ncbi:hypothetical protein PT2222_140081 [Paraburkholderia tropica]
MRENINHQVLIKKHRALVGWF